MADIFEYFFDVWAVDFDHSAIVRNINRKKNAVVGFILISSWLLQNCFYFFYFKPHVTMDLDRFSIVKYFWCPLYSNLFLKCHTVSNSKYFIHMTLCGYSFIHLRIDKSNNFKKSININIDRSSIDPFPLISYPEWYISGGL